MLNDRIRERAYALRDAREKERLRFVQERLDKQWRDGLDEARAKDSAAKNYQVKQDVLAQISEKIRNKQRLTEEEDAKVAIWKKQLDELEAIEKQKEEMRRAADQELLQGLRDQVFPTLILILAALARIHHERTRMKLWGEYADCY